jgi:cell division transport system permease protein
MQLVGATSGFITRPFVMRSLINGLYGSLIAIVLIGMVVFSVSKQMPELYDVSDMPIYALVIGGVVALGLIISWLSTAMAVRRYLRLKTDQLYR